MRDILLLRCRQRAAFNPGKALSRCFIGASWPACCQNETFKPSNTGISGVDGRETRGDFSVCSRKTPVEELRAKRWLTLNSRAPEREKILNPYFNLALLRTSKAIFDVASPIFRSQNIVSIPITPSSTCDFDEHRNCGSCFDYALLGGGGQRMEPTPDQHLVHLDLEQLLRRISGCRKLLIDTVFPGWRLGFGNGYSVMSQQMTIVATKIRQLGSQLQEITVEVSFPLLRALICLCDTGKTASSCSVLFGGEYRPGTDDMLSPLEPLGQLANSGAPKDAGTKLRARLHLRDVSSRGQQCRAKLEELIRGMGLETIPEKAGYG